MAGKNDELESYKKQVNLVQLAASRGVKFYKQTGQEYWADCPFHGGHDCFSISDKEGIWKWNCFGCGKAGSVFDFVMLHDKCTLKDAIDKVKEHAGDKQKWTTGAAQVIQTFTPAAADMVPKKSYSMADWQPSAVALQRNQGALDWLLRERGITAATATAMQLGFKQALSEGYNLPEEHEHARNGGWIMFPRIVKGRIVAIKMRGMAAKSFVQAANMNSKAMYNMDAINAMEPVFVTEGEFDTIVLEQAGFRAVSIPSASSHKLTPEAKVKLKEAAYIVLAGDNDGGVGNEAMKALRRELRTNTFIVAWPGVKDANDFWLKTCGQNMAKFQTEVSNLVKAARRNPVEGFTNLIDRLRITCGTDASKDPHRIHFPWQEVDRMNYCPAGSLVVIYSTYSGTGKSVFSTQLTVHEALRGERVVVYTPEIRDEAYIALVAAQNLPGGVDRAGFISQEQYNTVADILENGARANAANLENEFVYHVGHQLPVTDPEEVMTFIETTIEVLGATRFVIDTLACVVGRSEGESQTEAEGRLVNRLEKMGAQYGCTFILIGQSNKEAEGLKETSKDAQGVLRGSRELMDKAYGVYLLHRKRKPTAVAEGETVKDLLDERTLLILKKDRGRGPGNAVVNMVYVPAESKFRAVTNTAGAPPDNAPQGNMASGGDDGPPAY